MEARSALPDSRDGGASTAGRSAKRQRQNSTANDDSSTVELPPEVWAGVMCYLPFDAILSCGAVCRCMLQDVMPRLTSLRIDKSSQMNLTVASRFRDVTDIQINSLLKLRLVDPVDNLSVVEIDTETKIRIAPFLSRFSTLERVHFGGKTEDGNDIVEFAPVQEYFEEGDIYPFATSREVMLSFLDSLSGAFACGALHRDLKLYGLCCPDSSRTVGDVSHCTTCQRAAKSFPLESVVLFERRGSSSSNALSGRPYGLDVCLSRIQLESIIESRGGTELLSSEERVLMLLRSGGCYKLRATEHCQVSKTSG